MTLIIPDYLAAKYRPLADIPTQQLINELQARQLLAEMAAQIAMPDAEHMTGEVYTAARIEQFKLMFAQMGQAIGASPFAFTGIVGQPDVLDPTKAQEVLIAKIMILKHPAIPDSRPAAEPIMQAISQGIPLAAPIIPEDGA